MARMEMDYILKIMVIYSFCLGKLTKTLIMVYFLFENLLYIFLLVFNMKQ